jgi:lysine 2,3-aminomutase
VEEQLGNITQIVDQIRTENPVITSYCSDIRLDDDALVDRMRNHYQERMRNERPDAWAYYNGTKNSDADFFSLTWRDFAFIRMMDYLDHENHRYSDGFKHGKAVVSRPIGNLRMALLGLPHKANADHLEDMLNLLRQLNGTNRPDLPSRQQVLDWMGRHPSGLDKQVVAWRNRNKHRIVDLLVERILRESAVTDPTNSGIYRLDPAMDKTAARKHVLRWWREDRFHLRYAVRTVEDLDLYLDHSLDKQTLQVMREARAKGIPIFATPWFLSLIDVRKHPGLQRHSDGVLRSYLLYSQDLVDEFGKISAWEKEDVVQIGKPNAAGWILPSHNIHRRYPEVAIYIPSTMGRACGGLCAYCQRMYDFQNGRFNFNLDKLKPNRSWNDELATTMAYFRDDPRLADILITGGDALMSSTAALEKILAAVVEMATSKRADNATRMVDERYAEIKRVRLGTKLPIYLPQRITTELCSMLAEFKGQLLAVGVTQCVVQTHFSSAMEVTLEAKRAIGRLQAAGWAVTNQEVFTVAASRRGHSAKLRAVLQDIGVLPYYTFTVKGYRENRHLFANNARSIQERIEEKSIGRVDPKYHSTMRSFIADAKRLPEAVDAIRKADEIPFLATDRNTLNLPGVGKSNTYRTIGITDDGRRILEFEFDHSRPHSPAVASMGTVIVIESKSIRRYLDQVAQMGENPAEYESVWGYSAGRTEAKSPVFESVGHL